MLTPVSTSWPTAVGPSPALPIYPKGGPVDSVYNTTAPGRTSDHRSQADGRSEQHEDCSSSLHSLRVLHSQYIQNRLQHPLVCTHTPAGNGRRWNTRPSKGWRNLKWILSLRMLKLLRSLQFQSSCVNVQTRTAAQEVRNNSIITNNIFKMKLNSNPACC